MTSTILVSKSELLAKLNAARNILSKKQTTPIMSCFLFETHDGVLTVTAADAAGRIEVRIENAKSEDNISICLESAMLLDSLKTLPEQPLTFEINTENFETAIRYQGGVFQMIGKSSATFPKQKEIPEPLSLQFTSSQLLRGIEKVSFCAADDELRPIMNAVLVEIKDGELNFVSSDGHKLGLFSYKEAPAGAEPLSFPLPQKIANVLTAILPKNDTEVKIALGASNVKFEFSDFTLNAQLLEGRFPNYRSVIPQNNDKKVFVPVADLKSALSRVSVFTNQASQLVVFNLENEKLVLTGQDIDFSTNAEERLLSESSDQIKIGFKGTFLSEILSAIDSDRIVMTFSDASRASLILPEDNEKGERITYLLMPMMIND